MSAVNQIKFNATVAVRQLGKRRYSAALFAVRGLFRGVGQLFA
jgi:hypothetical protein